MGGPCRDCTDRSGECHATCEKYLTWSTERRAAKEKDHVARAVERYAHDRG